MQNKHESSIITYSNSDSLQARSELFDLMNNYVSTPEEKERSLGLFLRASLLSRIFAIRELYEMIIMIPGIILDIGTWRGQTAVTCENLRAIFEPLHFNRRIIAFDSFEGYKGFSEKDHQTNLHKNGTYSVENSYDDFLTHLLKLHEKNNAMGHINGKHKIIKGDCRETISDFFKSNPNEIVALAFFDLNCYEPTLKSLENILERTVPGGVIAFWQLTRDVVPAEGMVYIDKILTCLKHTIHRSKFYPGLCYIVKQ